MYLSATYGKKGKAKGAPNFAASTFLHAREDAVLSSTLGSQCSTRDEKMNAVVFPKHARAHVIPRDEPREMRRKISRSRINLRNHAVFRD